MLIDFTEQLDALVDAAEVLLSDILPSEWNEKHRSMTSDVSPRIGKFSYGYTPYLREPVDCLASSNPARIIAVMKGAQIGFSTGVIEGGIGWIIAESPSNILFLTGHADLSEEAVTGKIDNLIDNTGIRPLIKANTQRARNTRSGDTNKQKEFAGGSLVAGSAGNHKLLRQRSVRYGFIDDFDAAKNATVESGSTTKMIEQRFAAYSKTKKIYYISTPELKETSNIEPVYLKGDQRRYHIPCPCCDELIMLDWEIPMQDDPKEKGGITWELDDRNRLIRGSVGYICYKCGGFFDDSTKSEFLKEEGHGGRAKWIATAEPVSEEYVSFHISALYAPVGMDDWLHYVENYIEANPINEDPDDDAMKAFTNLCLGHTYEARGEAPKANQLQANTRSYLPNTVPENLSIRDGNGKIILLTLAIDLNGKVEDARIDYEVVGWAESGASYSITQGSIGTFVPKEKEYNAARQKWTYDHGRKYSVWGEVDKVFAQVFEKDTGKKMRVFIGGIDAPSHFAKQAYHYIDNSNYTVFALKGKDTEEKVTRFNIDVKVYKASARITNLYLLEVNLIKDQLAALMKLKASLDSEEPQPVGFMNFPQPTDGLYTYNGFYSQFEGEHRVVAKDSKGVSIGMKWAKRNSAVQNHFWDCRVYNMALREILVGLIGKELKDKDFTWRDYVELNSKQN